VDYGPLIDYTKMSKEEMAALGPEELIAEIERLNSENAQKDSLNEALTNELSNASKSGVEQKLKVGKKTYIFEYGAIQIENAKGQFVSVNYEDLKKLSETEVAKIIDNDEGSFTELF
jgi:hypothetical protein